FNGTRARSWAPCTKKRPASTGARPSRLALTQSFPCTELKARALAASDPAANATIARTAASFGQSRKWTATAHCPGPAIWAEPTASNVSKLAATPSRIARAVASSVTRRATTLEDGEGSARIDKRQYRALARRCTQVAQHHPERKGLGRTTGRRDGLNCR